MNDLNTKVDQISSANPDSEARRSCERLPGTKEERKSKSSLKKKPNSTEKSGGVKSGKKSSQSKEHTTLDSEKLHRDGSSMNFSSKQKKQSESQEEPYSDAPATTSKKSSSVAIHKPSKHMKNKHSGREKVEPVIQLEKTAPDKMQAST